MANIAIMTENKEIGTADEVQNDRGTLDGEVLHQNQQPAELIPASALFALLEAAPAVQKKAIGEHLYPLVRARQPDLAGRLTGMLLEMENSELLQMLQSPEAVTSHTQEALQVSAKEFMEVRPQNSQEVILTEGHNKYDGGEGYLWYKNPSMNLCVEVKGTGRENNEAKHKESDVYLENDFTYDEFDSKALWWWFTAKL